ncbi:MAG: hypothetical protein GKR93_18935 [Gammaproteobacteria bacterium]|nr:hypothetical protein [Gammaproteobacteria bacterium]
MQNRESAFSVFIRISYRPPSALLYLILFSHLGAVFSVYYAALPLLPTLLCMILILINLLHLIYQFRQMKKQVNAAQICLTKKNEWLIIDNNIVHKARLKPATLVHPCLVILRFKSEMKNSWCFILNGENVERDTFRRLRVRLLHGETASC